MKILIPILLAIILSLWSDNFVGAIHQSFLNCSVSRFCGAQPISFPFYTEEEHNYCGYPGFRLFCDNENVNPIPILKLYGEEYIVHRIFYENQSLIVSNTAFSQPNNTACFPRLRNLSLPADFTLASNENSTVFLVQNCNSSSLGADLLKYKIGCSAENDTNPVLALPERDRKLVANASRKCGIGSSAVALPVLKHGSENGSEIIEVLRRGFMLYWIASNCSLCSSTRGKCGFDYPTFHFKCFCPDRPHAARCNMPEQTSGQKGLPGKKELSFITRLLFLLDFFFTWILV